MNLWADDVPAALLTENAAPVLNYNDALLSKLVEARNVVHNALEAASAEEPESDLPSDKSVLELLSAVCDGDLVTVEAIARAHPAALHTTYPSGDGGVPSLIFAVAFDHYPVAESLLVNHSVDPDTPDNTSVRYSPLMWAVHLDNLPMVKLLLDFQADPNYSPAGDGKDAVSLVSMEDAAIYDFFLSHNLLNAHKSSAADDDAGLFVLNSAFAPEDEVDDATHHIRMQMASVTLDNPDEEDPHDNPDEEQELALDAVLVQTPDFDYEKLLTDQYIKFTDSDIPSLLDYIFALRVNNPSLQHTTKIPAAVVFQLIRYSHFKVNSPDLTTFLFECFLARLRAVTNTKSGVFNMALTEQSGDKASVAAGAGDIVLLSYWLSVIQFLHYYFAKSKVYQSYPVFLQELINVTQSLVATLSFSINSRLNHLVDSCLLNFTNLVDVSSVLYAKDWNLFKNKPKSHPNNFNDILDMLFPPSLTELIKPSPLKYVQVLGALDYVLKIHEVDPLLRFETFSQVFYYINATIFNRIMASSRYCSRAKAIQIRLNVSALEDWLRSHNYRIYKPEQVGGLAEYLPQEEHRNSLRLHNLLSEGEGPNDPHSLLFYYKSLYHIGKGQLMPTIELLQWLQCMSALTDEGSFINTINQFDYLNYYQLFKVTNKLYKYEVEERKLPKPLLQLLKRLMNERGEEQISKSLLHYMTQSTFMLKELYIYLNPNFVFGVALPNLNELIVRYGAGLGGVKALRAKKYQPTLPIDVLDDVDELLTNNKNANVNDTYDYEEDAGQDEEKEDEEGTVAENGDRDSFKGDGMFKSVQLPLNLAHKNWGDNDENPW